MNLINWLTLTIRVVDFNLVANQPDLIGKLRLLTLGPTSGLNYELDWMLKEAITRHLDCKVFLAYRFRSLVGWGLLSKEDSNFEFTEGSLDSVFRKQDGYLFQVFIEPGHRRQGIASEIFQAAQKIVKEDTFCIGPWDNASYHFYSKFCDVKKKHL
jgi:GNAT superfamily N-acetyltransferase